ncbi:MAG: hypothetical protein WKF41_04080 [Gaiellaceae bacterium]
MTRQEIATRRLHDEDPRVVAWADWARKRGRGEALRLLDPFVAAGYAERNGDEVTLTSEGEQLIRDMLAPASQAAA